ncbi:ABC transporter substrate-binding protein [Agromyces aerolatus]|uniref:ABC transporter substrate-binding protein n=1 Tax=Agromyces sp. LY-1074 TaxID=3074080 RepID=UPI00285C12A2|nr:MULTISPECIES: ABC transporter substrate-binding protein [unclassified Agromyces]MDR5698998.1 ABC transporter substrate-binding protein [Agromyces sp. LY-1074]MDR5705224.1 ABC transporter substrate-binding protein [Agromyces sp. LY-1358]
MNSTPRFALTGLAALAAATTLAACSGGGAAPDATGEYADGAAFTMSLSGDPGSLDPQLSATGTLFQLTKFAYDPLVSIDLDGEIGSQLATDWVVDGTTATLTIADDITCSDGSAFTAQTAVDNLAFLSDPENASPYLGSFLPPGITAEADGDTLTLTLAAPAPFLMHGLANVPMVCEAGLADRSSLVTATNGTGPYVLDEAVANDHFAYSLREDYAWGPGGLAGDEPGLPATVTARIVPNETTAANLLLSGEINAAQVVGPDAERLEAANLFQRSTPLVLGEQWYNEAEGRPTSDPAVRMALTQALDLAELRKVVTSGKDLPATSLTAVEPAACTFDSVTDNLPQFDVAAAEQALDDAGWVAGADGVRAKDGVPLAVTFVHDTVLGTPGASAAELAVEAWQELGVQVDAQAQDSTAIAGVMFGTGAWDIMWEPVNVNTPSQMVGFLSGPGVPGGTNFASIQNADYEAAVAEAMQLPGAEGCQLWAEAEAALVRDADVVPFANNALNYFGSGAEFSLLGNIAPTSIRMLG